jgi:Na+/phosphate symporter
MIGGIAHNLKTPIMSISGAIEGIRDLIKEYNLSIYNPQVNSEDHHAIAKDMSDWVEKIKNYLEYMSDVITAVKGQAVNFSEEEQYTFTIAELMKHVKDYLCL